MSRSHPVEPQEGWAPGDRAYCISGSRLTRPSLEEGKVYVVGEVIQVPNTAQVGLVLLGVALPDGKRGLQSSRFVKLRPGESGLQQIARSTSYGRNDARPSESKRER